MCVTLLTYQLFDYDPLKPFYFIWGEGGSSTNALMHDLYDMPIQICWNYVKVFSLADLKVHWPYKVNDYRSPSTAAVLMEVYWITMYEY